LWGCIGKIILLRKEDKMVQKILEMKEEYEKIFHPKGAIRVMGKDDYIFYALVEIIQILQSKK
jgi:hypothetical protein